MNIQNLFASLIPLWTDWKSASLCQVLGQSAQQTAAGKLIDVNFTQIVIQSIRVVFINTNQVNDSIVPEVEPIAGKW